MIKYWNGIFVAVMLIALSTNVVVCQSPRKYRYDSALVGDRITPAVSAIMMPRTYTEVILNNSLLTTNAYFGSNRDQLDLDHRSTYLINTLQVTHGVSASGRFNVGLDLSYRTGREDADRDSSPLKVFGNDSEGLRYYARGLTSFGVRARYAVTRNRNFVIQQAVYIPFDASSQDKQFLGDNRYASNTQFLYTQLLGRKVFLFGQADILVRFKSESYSSDYTVPLNLFTSYLLTSRIFPFVQLGMLNSWDHEFDHSIQSFTYGAGLQYQFTTMFTVNVFYNNVFAGQVANKWTGVNLGIRGVF